jgi:hypothetical protein
MDVESKPLKEEVLIKCYFHFFYYFVVSIKKNYFFEFIYNLITKLILKKILKFMCETSFDFIFAQIRFKCRLLLIQVEIVDSIENDLYELFIFQFQSCASISFGFSVISNARNRRWIHLFLKEEINSF